MQEYNNTYDSKMHINLLKVLNYIALPFLLELPLIVILMKLLGVESLLHNFGDAYANLESVELYCSIFKLFSKISLLFLFAYIVAAIVTSIKSKYVKWGTKLLFYFIILLLYAVQHFLAQNFGILEFSPTYFVLLAETTDKESREFLSQYILSDTILPTLTRVLFYISIIVVFEFIWNYLKRKINILNTKCISLLLIPILLCGIYSTNIYIQILNVEYPDNIRFIEPPTDPLSSIYSSLVMLHKMNENMVQGVEVNKTISEHSVVCNMNDSVNIIVVIGESYIKWHSPLYGYNLNTSPNLFSEVEADRLFVFDDVVSSSNSTSIVIRNILCCNNSSEDELYYEYPNFMNIFKKAGYDVYFWDNQRDCNKTASYSFTLNSFLYNNDIVDMSYTLTNDASYKFDKDIVKSFNERVKFTNEKNLVIFHLMGQHIAYAERFPQSATLFTVDSVKRDDKFLNDEMKQCIADYDNATLYNDYVLSLILDTFKNSNTILFYFSDHGDEVYNYRAKCGRDHADLNDQLLKYQYDIPFVIWCSDIYKEKYPETVDAIRQAVKRPFIIDNICNTLFNVGAINSAYYRDSLDIISPNYKCAKRKIKKNGKTFVYEDVRCK
mgnify:CR=1 FL=1